MLNDGIIKLNFPTSTPVTFKEEYPPGFRWAFSSSYWHLACNWSLWTVRLPIYSHVFGFSLSFRKDLRFEISNKIFSYPCTSNLATCICLHSDPGQKFFPLIYEWLMWQWWNDEWWERRCVPLWEEGNGFLRFGGFCYLWFLYYYYHYYSIWFLGHDINWDIVLSPAPVSILIYFILLYFFYLTYIIFIN